MQTAFKISKAKPSSFLIQMLPEVISKKHITYKNSFVDRRASLMDLQKSKLKKENSLHCTMSSAGLIQNSTSTIVHQKNLSRMPSLSELDFVSGNLSKGQ